MTLRGSERAAVRPRLRIARAAQLALALLGTLLMTAAMATPAQAAFGVESFTGEVADAQGDPATQAGSHPDTASTTIKFNTASDNGATVPDGAFKSIEVELPPGFVANPTATPRCTVRTFIDSQGFGCPKASQVGMASIRTGPFPFPPQPIYNLVPRPGVPAQFAFAFLSNRIFFNGVVRTGDDYGVGISLPNNSQALPVFETSATFWGVPADHNGSDEARKPFLSNPSDCSAGLLTTTLKVDSWQDPGNFKTASFDHDVNDVPMEVEGCDKLDFRPKLSLQPASNQAGVPSSYSVDLRLPQSDNPDGLATANLKKTVVRLPEGVTVSPSAASGLGACAPDEIGLDSAAASTCPESSKIGTLRIKTPLLPDPLEGAIYLAKQGDNPYGSLLAIYLVAEGSGVTIKIPGRVDTDPQTGQLTARFDDTPQLPFDDFSLNFFGGSRAALVNPPTAGHYTTVTELTSWSGQTVVSESSFEIAGQSARQFAPTMTAGVADSAPAASSPFSLRIARDDGDEELKSITAVQLPEGLLGRVSSVDLCAEAQAAAGACPDGSRVGQVQIAAGAGSSPLWVPQAGKSPTGVYLTGPYAGAPYGLSIVVPAQAGPFDLGTVIVRSALRVDERTAQITSGVDEARLIDHDGTVTAILPGALPRILKGIVLDQREIRLIVDREGFMVNPTDCSPQRITADIGSYGGRHVALASRFTATNCASLGFAPRFRAKILNKGRKSTLRSFHPRTRFTVVPRKGDANIGSARVALPSSTILDQANIGTTCTRAQMAARDCPAASVVGYARAWSPLLRRAVEGPVYLAANGGVRPLPDLAAVLDGEIRVVLQGEIATQRGGGKARLQNTFRVVPDAPVTRFVLTMRGGKNKGLLVNSTDLCRTGERGVAVFTGQNNRRHRLRPRIATTFKGCGKARRQAARRAFKRKQASNSVAHRIARSAAARSQARQLAVGSMIGGRLAR